MKKEISKILSQEKIGTDIYSMWVEKTSKKKPDPGQFVSLYVNDSSRLLPRPISICEAFDNRLRLVYRVAGGGTKEMAAYKQGDTIGMIAPLGNGFTLRKKSALLVGGGIGIPPMVELSKALSEIIGKERVTAVLGYRDEIFLNEEISRYCNVIIATENGSFGVKGTVINAIENNNIDFDVIYACGPVPMLRAIKDLAIKRNTECQISLEERMACGIGACLGCVCRTNKKDSHSNVFNRRVCKDGPVFDAPDIEF